MNTRPILGLLVLAITTGCAWLKGPPPPELSSPRSPLVYVYQRPLEVTEADWSVCDLEADRLARLDYRVAQEVAWGILGGFGAAGVVGAALVVGTAGVVLVNEATVAQVPVVQRRRVREQLADNYARRMHRCLTARGYRLPVPPPVPRHDYSRCSATTLDEC